MNSTIIGVAIGACGVFAARFGYLVLKKGWGWGLAKLKVWWNEGKADLEGTVAGVTKDVATLKADVATIKTKVGL